MLKRGGSARQKEVTAMNVIPDKDGKIKVLLTKDDISELGLSLDSLDCSNPDTRILLKTVYQLAAIKTDRVVSGNRLLIEAYPHINGGGILYFTPLLGKAPRKGLRLKRIPPKVKTLNYVFEDGDGLLKAICILYSNLSTRNLCSEAYDVDGVFLLSVYTSVFPSILHRIKEFSENFFIGDHLKKHTREHGKALTGRNAILEIGEKINRGI